MSRLEKRIEEAREELHLLSRVNADPSTESGPILRLIERAERRLADLEAVRRGEAVECYATCAVDARGVWNSYGTRAYDAMSKSVLEGANMESGDRITVARFIARKPIVATDETEAEVES